SAEVFGFERVKHGPEWAAVLLPPRSSPVVRGGGSYRSGPRVADPLKKLRVIGRIRIAGDRDVGRIEASVGMEVAAALCGEARGLPVVADTGAYNAGSTNGMENVL